MHRALAPSTIVGMIPLAGEWALGAERFSPLAIAGIGGLTAATFLTLVVIPVLYEVMDDVASAFSRLIGGREKAAQEPPAPRYYVNRRLAP